MSFEFSSLEGENKQSRWKTTKKTHKSPLYSSNDKQIYSHKYKKQLPVTVNVDILISELKRKNDAQTMSYQRKIKGRGNRNSHPYKRPIFIRRELQESKD